MSETTHRSYTNAEANELVKNLSQVFSVVRILKMHEVAGEEKIDGVKPCYCFEFWGKKVKCENCTSYKTLLDKKDRTKVEYLDDKPYQVFSIYLNVDGEDCVLEILKDFTIVSSDPDDLTKLADNIFHLNEKLYKDSLTGALNRTYFDERKTKRLNHAGIIFTDIDDFKNINDTYGHDIGDIVLKEVSSVFSSSVRSDDSVIRVGGDEFVLILPKINHNILSLKLDYILKRINEIEIPQCPNLRITVTMGAAICDNQTLQEVAARADKLMLEAKKYKNVAFKEWDHNNIRNSELHISNKPYLLLVDDAQLNRDILKTMLADEYTILEAKDGIEAIKLVEDYRQNLAVILLDLQMPNMNGFSFLKKYSDTELFDDIPVIIISSDTKPEVITNSYNLGAIDYISRPFNEQIVKQRVHNIVRLFTKQRKFKTELRQQINSSDFSVQILAIVLRELINEHNHEDSSHLAHVQQLTTILLDELINENPQYAISSTDRRNIIIASNLHDIGKLGLDDRILKDSNLLSAEDKEIYKTHTLIGSNMIDGLDIYRNEPLIKCAYNICRWHHEKYDGTGYPDGLSGDAIPIEAQIVSLAIVFDALVRGNEKQKGHSPKEVIEIITTTMNNRFNPLLLKCLSSKQEEIINLYQK